ncbi:hypothetical protein ACK2M2_08190 [Acinetobacter sp. TY1]|uniref:hypothetical protein n=1 Tax=unclassified Acinetobacter TaxID=196816 RepID=UPI00306B1A5E
MKVVAYLHNADLLLEDEQGVAIVGGSHYVLSLGDQVVFQNVIDEQAKLFQVNITFSCADHAMQHQDEIQIKFEGCRDQLKSYLAKTTVH